MRKSSAKKTPLVIVPFSITTCSRVILTTTTQKRLLANTQINNYELRLNVLLTVFALFYDHFRLFINMCGWLRHPFLLTFA